MRIISGKFKGRSINFLKNLNTRPLKASVRENIFNVLTHSNLIKKDFENTVVLDLYSGIGSFGIESLSRGIKEVTFVERDLNAFNILKDNLKHFSLLKKTIVVNDDIKNFLKKNKKQKYNIFFFDPPFSSNLFIDNLSFLKKNKMFKTDHLIIIHRERKTKDKLDKFMNTLLIKQYGRSKIIFGIFN